jgi:hypothetical protein
MDSVGLTIRRYRNKNKPREFISVSPQKMPAGIRPISHPFCLDEVAGRYIDPILLYESFGSFQRTP